MKKLNLPTLSPPRELSDRLRVMASREALRRRRRASLEVFLTHMREEAELVINNLMRPYAVPAVGGVLSTLVLFGILAPYLSVNLRAQGGPGRAGYESGSIGALATPAAVESAFFMSLEESGEVVIDVSIDEQGRVIGYTIPRGQGWAQDPELVRNVETALLGTRFTPATLFGKPASGRTRVFLRRSAVDVQG
ncbi:MAG: hypothetical protein R2729_17415 [Bryobacteraceae bacterium]